MFRKRKAQQEMEEISRMLERILNGECIQQEEVRYEDTLPAKIRYQIRRISEKNQCQQPASGSSKSRQQ